MAFNGRTGKVSLAETVPGASSRNTQHSEIGTAPSQTARSYDIGSHEKKLSNNKQKHNCACVYAFPILVALLAAQKGDIIVIDSPEAHLHPQAQSRMGRMLATFAAAGIQILIETHSDHVLNGVRLSVRDKVINPEQLSLLFFAGVSTDSHGVTSPRVDIEGRLDEWPEGFFDQSDKDVSRLAGWE